MDHQINPNPYALRNERRFLFHLAPALSEKVSATLFQEGAGAQQLALFFLVLFAYCFVRNSVLLPRPHTPELVKADHYCMFLFLMIDYQYYCY